MAGSEIDFVDDLIGSSFKINNPKATASCGCGQFALRRDPCATTVVRFEPSGRAHRHLERQLDQAAPRRGGRLARRSGSPTSSACRKPNASTRPSRASRSRRSATTSPSTAKRPSTASRMLSKLPFDEVSSGLPGDDGDDHARFIEAVVSTERGALRVASHLSAQRQSAGDREISPTSSAWMERLLCLCATSG